VKLTKIVLLGAVAVLLLTGSDSFAGAAKGQGEGFVAAFQARFDLIDANKDGKVSRQEYVDFHAKQAGKRFDGVDKEKKGYVTKEEVKAVVEEATTKMQENRKRWLEKKQQMQQQRQQQE
jgi:Ca2+-binding EF-hand superfamily protein